MIGAFTSAKASLLPHYFPRPPNQKAEVITLSQANEATYLGVTLTNG